MAATVVVTVCPPPVIVTVVMLGPFPAQGAVDRRRKLAQRAQFVVKAPPADRPVR